MQKLSLIGNLGNDAVVKSSGNNQFVTFNVAVTTKRKNGDQTIENTNWYDCSFDNLKLADYLKKGTKVYLEGGFKADLYFSEKANKWLPKVNVFVNSIELLSAKKEDSTTAQARQSAEPTPEQSFEADANNKTNVPF